jgi:ABC-type cobalt transport system substrate-binding protein
MIIITIILILILAVLVYIIVKNKKSSNIQEQYVDVNGNTEILGMAPYFNPFFTLPSNCMETLFDTVQCYKLPDNIWEDDWWVNR